MTGQQRWREHQPHRLTDEDVGGSPDSHTPELLQVLLAVADQDGALDEGAQAEVALVGLLARVGEHVAGQGLLEGEGGTAVEAAEGPVPRVDERVPLQAASPREHPRAPLAPELRGPSAPSRVQEVRAQLQAPVCVAARHHWNR